MRIMRTSCAPSITGISQSMIMRSGVCARAISMPVMASGASMIVLTPIAVRIVRVTLRM